MGLGDTDGRDLPATCSNWKSHYAALQAVCDAIGWTAQEQMAEHLDDVSLWERYYGIWLGVGWVLRAAESWYSDMEEPFQQAMKKISWTPGKEYFDFPGREAFPSRDQQHLPGDSPPVLDAPIQHQTDSGTAGEGEERPKPVRRELLRARQTDKNSEG